jgi:hypothetical protein
MNVVIVLCREIRRKIIDRADDGFVVLELFARRRIRFLFGSIIRK